MQNVESTPRKEKRGYGGKWKKWLLIYLVIGAVVYAIIYFAFLNGSGGYGLIPLPLFSIRYVMDRIRRH